MAIQLLKLGASPSLIRAKTDNGQWLPMSRQQISGAVKKALGRVYQGEAHFSVISMRRGGISQAVPEPILFLQSGHGSGFAARSYMVPEDPRVLRRDGAVAADLTEQHGLPSRRHGARSHPAAAAATREGSTGRGTRKGHQGDSTRAWNDTVRQLRDMVQSLLQNGQLVLKQGNLASLQLLTSGGVSCGARGRVFTQRNVIRAQKSAWSSIPEASAPLWPPSGVTRSVGWAAEDMREDASMRKRCEDPEGQQGQGRLERLAHGAPRTSSATDLVYACNLQAATRIGLARLAA